MPKEEVRESSPPSKIRRLDEDEDEDLSLSKSGSLKDEDEDLSLSKPGTLEDEDEDEDVYSEDKDLEDEDLEYEYEDEDEDDDWKPRSPQFEEEEEVDLEDEDEDLEDDCAFRVADMTLSKPGPLADEYAPRLLDSVPKLPKDTWAQWKSQAVYFVGRFCGSPASQRNFGGLSIYAIDPSSTRLPVYNVFDFTYPCHTGKAVAHLSCAVVGSSVYVSGNGTSLWVRQIGDEDAGWVEGPQFTKDKCSPELFSLGGRLCALRYDPTDFDYYPDAFEVLVDGEWHSLNAPPPCFWVDNHECCYFAGLSCIGDSTMIVHLVKHQPLRHRFLRFHLKDGFSGEWTDLASTTPSPFASPFPNLHFTYNCHVYDDDPLLLPAFSRGAIFPVFGLGAEPVGDSLDLKVGADLPFPWESFEKKHRNLQWHLIGLGRNRYCAIAFDSVFGLNPTVFRFELRLADGAETASLKDVWVKRHVFGGSQKAMQLISGKAYFNCTSC